MRLMECYVENFGGLSNYSCTFDPGLAVFHAPNGAGKTTLAEFIRAMFYGFPRANKALEKNRRKKYRPWQGGRYGGSLTFAHGGAVYRIERFFGSTPASDTFALYDMGTRTRSAAFSPDIGVELFQLDADSFERSTYLPQSRDALPLATDSIRAKLGDLVDDTNDVNNYEKAVRALQARRSSLVPFRGQGGAVGRAQQKVSELESALSAGRERELELAQLRRELAAQKEREREQEAERDAVLEQIRLASEAAGRASVLERLGQLEEDCRRACQVREALLEKYPGGFPPEEEIDALLRDYDGMAPLTAPPSGAAAYEDARRQLERQAEAPDQALPPAEQARLEELERFFRGGAPSDGELAEKQEELRRLELLRRENSAAPPPRRKAGALAPAVLGAVAVAAGVVLLALQRFAAGGVLLGAGVLALVLAVYLRLKDMVVHGASPADRRRAQENELAARRLEEGLEGFLSGYALEGGLSERLAELAARQREYRLLAQTRASVGQARAQLLREERARSEALVREYEAELAAREEKLAAFRGRLRAFAGKYGLELDPGSRQRVQDLRDDARDCREAGRRAEERGAELGRFREKNRPILDAPDPGEAYDLPALRAEKERLEAGIAGTAKAILAAEQRAGVLQSEADQLPQREDELAYWKTELREGRENAALLDRTMDFLGQAKEQLSTSYLGDLEQSFSALLGRLAGGEGGRASVDPQLEVRLERGGQQRELAYFSAGQSDLVMLCMRVALVDALFKDVKPFLILDDPFANLDDGHTARALDLLRDLARERQILYFVCSGSRAPEHP